MANTHIIDLFSGGGGWAAGLHLLGVDPATTLGFDNDVHASATHTAAGFPTVVGDLSATDLTQFTDVDGLIASPPCQAFSLAGRGKGRENIGLLIEHIAACVDGWLDLPAALVAEDVRADLTLEPLRWACALRPRWLAFEQVPPVLPAWRAMKPVLEAWGYSVDVGLLSAERYGVPQTRKRAILVARRDGVPARLPYPTHTSYNHRVPNNGRYAEGRGVWGPLLPWVSMADALGWGSEDHKYAAGTMANAASRGMSEPASTIAFGHNANQHQWVTERPSTTVQTGSTITGPGHHAAFGVAPGTQTATGGGQAAPGAAPTSTEGVRVTTQQAAALQSFPEDWPWQGPRTAVYRQIGNAVAPLFGAAVLAQFVDVLWLSRKWHPNV